MANFNNWAGQTAYDSDNKKVGEIQDLYLDDESDTPTWATIRSSSLFGSKVHFTPVRYADETDDGIRFNVTQSSIKGAPSVDTDTTLSAEDEGQLRAYYNSEPSENRAGRVRDDEDTDTTGDGHDTSGPDTDDAMTRSEERLDISKTTQQTGVARLRKYIVTEQVHTTVPVQKEVVSIEREPITDDNRDEALTGAELSEEEHEMTLSEEKVVVSKQTVPVERIRMTKNIVTDTVVVDESVSKEKVDVDES